MMRSWARLAVWAAVVAWDVGAVRAADEYCATDVAGRRGEVAVCLPDCRVVLQTPRDGGPFTPRFSRAREDGTTRSVDARSVRVVEGRVRGHEGVVMESAEVLDEGTWLFHWSADAVPLEVQVVTAVPPPPDVVITDASEIMGSFNDREPCRTTTSSGLLAEEDPGARPAAENRPLRLWVSIQPLDAAVLPQVTYDVWVVLHPPADVTAERVVNALPPSIERISNQDFPDLVSTLGWEDGPRVDGGEAFAVVVRTVMPDGSTGTPVLRTGQATVLQGSSCVAFSFVPGVVGALFLGRGRRRRG